MKKPIKVPDQDAAYLREHHTTQSVPEMAKILKRATVTVYKFMEALKLTPKGRVIHYDHPFKKSNRKLEKFLVHQRIENSRNGGYNL